MPLHHDQILDRALTRLRFRQLRLLVTVADMGNIQKAAQAIHISQPAATKMIKDLELDFEVPLFERTNRGVVPTAFGEALVRHGKLIFAQLSNAAQELEDISEGSSGRVVIGTLLAASSQLLPRAVEQMIEARPNVALKIIEGTNEVLMPALRAGEIDMVVGRLPTLRHRSELVQERLFDGQIIAVAGPQHPLAQARSLGFEALAASDWIVPPPETSLRRQIDAFFQQKTPYPPRIAVESISYLTNRALLQNHDFVGLMPAPVAAQDIENGTLVALDWDVPFGDGPVGVSYRQDGEQSPAGTVFLDILRSIGRQIDQTT